MWHATTKMIDAQSFRNLKRAAVRALSGIFPATGSDHAMDLPARWCAIYSELLEASSCELSPPTCVHVHIHVHVQSFSVAVASAAR